MLHRSSDHASVSGNNVFDNGDSGLALMESSYITANDNTFNNNLCERARRDSLCPLPLHSMMLASDV